MAIPRTSFDFAKFNLRLVRFYAVLPLPIVFVLGYAFSGITQLTSAQRMLLIPAATALFLQPTAIFIVFPRRLRFISEAEVAFFKAIPFLRKFGEAMKQFLKKNEPMEPELKAWLLNMCGTLFLAALGVCLLIAAYSLVVPLVSGGGL